MLLSSLSLVFVSQIFDTSKVDDQPIKTSNFFFHSLLNLSRITIEKNPSRRMLSPIVWQPNLQKKISGKIEVIDKALDLDIRMAEFLLLASILLTLKDRFNNTRNNKIFARSNIITVKKWVTILVSVPTISQKTSFSLGDLIDNNYSQHRNSFCDFHSCY